MLVYGQICLMFKVKCRSDGYFFDLPPSLKRYIHDFRQILSLYIYVYNV